MAIKPHGRNDNLRWRNARRRTIDAANGRCQLCHEPLTDAPAKHPDATEVDHIAPLSAGGDPYALPNLRAVHRRCHQQRDQLEAQAWRDGLYWCGHRTGCCPHSVNWDHPDQREPAAA